MFKIFTRTAILTALALAVPAGVQAQIYHLSNDWSDTSNPNGAWSYGAGLTHYAQPTTSNSLNSAAANGYWGTSADFFTTPFVLKATSNGSATGAYNDNDFLAGDVLIHSPNSGAPAAITWTAPGAGSIVLSSSVWYAHSIVTRSDDVMALLNSIVLGSATVTNGITRANQLTLASGSYTVAAGDILVFDFAKTSGQEFGSVAGIAATIDFTAKAPGGVPEPASWALMLGGFGLLGTAMRRRRATEVFA